MHAPPGKWRAWGRGMPRVRWLGWLPSPAGRRKRRDDPASPRSLSASLGQGNRFIPLPLAAPAACRSWMFGHDPWRSSPLGQGLSLAYAGAELGPQSPQRDKGAVLHARNASRSRRRTAYDCPPATAMRALSLSPEGCGITFLFAALFAEKAGA